MTTVFLVEDNADHALLIRKALGEEELNIRHFPNGPAALAFLDQSANPEEWPSLILLDLKLPGLDGFQVLKAIRSRSQFRSLPVVILTTSKQREEINQAYELGASGFVTKADDFTDMQIQMNRIKDYWLKTVERPAVAR